MSSRLSLLCAADVQQQFADALRRRRKALKLSRTALAERSTVPAATLKKFETSGEISLRQFLLLWQCLDRLERLSALCHEESTTPRNIAEVLRS